MTLERKETIHLLAKAKKVTFLPGICLLINAMTGPAIPFAASLFQEAGYIPVILLFLVFAILSTLSCLFIVESMQAIPGNKHFQGTVEFGTLINFYFGKWAHYIGQMCLYGTLQSNAIQSIVLSAQTFDNIFVDIFQKSCGVALSGNSTWLCTSTLSDSGSPFTETMFLTYGFLAVLIISLPLAKLNLDDNVGIQIGASLLSAIILLQWIVASILYRVGSSDIPTVPVATYNLSSTVGTIMFSMAFTYVVPSWVNIKRRTVNAQHSLWISSLSTMGLYILIGVVPAICFVFPASSGGNLLPVLAKKGVPMVLTKISTYAFALIMLLPSIPVSFIVANNNLVQNDVVPKHISIFFSYIFPWFMAIPLLSGSKLDAFLTWTSLIFVSSANFIVPVLIYLRCLKFRTEYNSNRILSEKQRLLLKSIHWTSSTIQTFLDNNNREEKPVDSSETTVTETPSIQIEDCTDQLQVAQPPLRRTVSAFRLRRGTTYVRPYTEANDEPAPLNTDVALESYLKEDVPDPEAELRTERTFHQRDTELGIIKRSNTTLALTRPSEMSPPEHDAEPMDENLLFIKQLPPRSVSFHAKVRLPTEKHQDNDSSSEDEKPKDNLHRLATLPYNPNYVSPTFRSLPFWFPLSPKTVAYMCLFTTSALTFGNIFIALRALIIKS